MSLPAPPHVLPIVLASMGLLAIIPFARSELIRQSLAISSSAVVLPVASSAALPDAAAQPLCSAAKLR